MSVKETDNRKPLLDCLSENILQRILEDIGQASMCWEHPKKAGVFEAKKAADIAFELCHFIADALQEGKMIKGGNQDDQG